MNAPFGFCLVSVTLLVACGAAEVESQQLKDGSYQVTCQLSMDQCVYRVQDQCRHQRYRILEGTSEVKLRDAPPFEKAYHTSRLHLVCTDDGDAPLVSFGGEKPGADKPSAVKPAQASSKVCTTGETRACVGPGACPGGQACLPNGQGFGACDCGPATPPAPAVESAPPTPPLEGGPPPPAP